MSLRPLSPSPPFLQSPASSLSGYNMEKLSEPCSSVRKQAPWLVFFSHEKRKKTQTFFSIVEGRSYVKSIPQLSKRICLLSSHGWLLMMEKKTKDCSLFNPKTMENILLPPLLSGHEFCYDNIQYIMSSAPTDPNCLLLFLARRKPEIMFCHLSQKTWRKFNYKLDEPGGLSKFVACNGKLYGLTDQCILVVVDFDPDPNVVVLQGIQLPEKGFRLVAPVWQRDLVESCGEIFIVFKELTYNLITDATIVVTLNVYKVDFVKKKWVEVQTIGDRAFFLCKSRSLSCSATEFGIRGDIIYYVEDGDPSLYQFDMADRGICVDLPCPNMSTPWNAPHWIFLDEVYHPRSLPPSQKSKLESTSSETDDLMDYSSRNEVVVEKGSVTVDSASEVGPWSDPVTVILELIASRLSIADRLSMSRVCKTWFSVVCTIPSHNGLSYGFPCQASIDRDGKTCTLTDPKCNELHITCQNLPSHCIILYSNGGWLLVLHPFDYEKLHSVFFFNPLTKAKIDLPNINLDYRIYSFAFSTPPTSPECIVIAFCIYGSNILVCRRGERKWTVLVGEDSYFRMGQLSPVFCNGSFYFLADDGKLGVFDPITEAWSITPNEASIGQLLSRVKEFYLVESDGEFIMVSVDKFGDMVRVHKLDTFTKKWEVIDTLGGRTLFVGRRSSICSKADVLIGNGIYFPRVKDGEFMFYSLEDRKFCPGGNFCRSKVFPLSFWVDPVFDSSYEEQLKWNE